MPDDRYWVGGTSTDFNTAANWKQADLLSAGAVPVDGDSAYYTTGIVDCVGFDASAINLVNFITTSGYSGQFGADGDPLIIDCEVFTFQGQGAANYIQIKTDTAVDTDTVVTVLGTGSGADALHLSTSTNGTIATPSYLGGNVTIDDGAAHDANTNILIGSSSVSNPISLTIGASVTNIATITMLDGTGSIGSAFTTLTQTGGTLTHTAGDLTAANVYGGTFKPESPDYTSVDIKAYNNAFVDGSDSEIARTWTDIELFQGSRIDIANDRNNITLTNGIITHIIGQLPITVDQGATVAIS